MLSTTQQLTGKDFSTAQVANLIAELDAIRDTDKIKLIESKLTDDFLSKLVIIQDNFCESTFIQKDCNEMCYDLLDEVDDEF
jgi:hypothetical protein